jgi:hypothetical protein
MDGRRDRVVKLVSDDSVPYPVLFDGKGWQNDVASLYGVRSLPTTLIVGRDGCLFSVNRRPEEAGFEEAIKSALAK